jgi:hypothetical protein
MVTVHKERTTAMNRWLAASILLLCPAGSAFAGVLNPNISVVGQPFMRWTDDESDPTRKRPMLDAGEVETVFDDYLNPYARGTFVLSLGEEGIEVEEGYFELLRGLPGGLTVKGGKYRVGFGKLNPQHPHAVPFAERFHVLGAYLPGDESLDETGLSVSERLPAPGDFSLTATGDWLQGSTFRIEREPGGAGNDPVLLFGADGDRPEEPRPAFLGRLAGFGQIGDRSGYELGISGTEGTNNVAAGARTRVLGADAKLKLWNSAYSYLILQGEVLHLERDDAGWDSTAAAYTTSRVTATGGYAYADYNFKIRYNVGAGFERYQDGTPDKIWNTGFKVFAGYSLLEETTVFRLDWDHLKPGTPAGASESPAAVNAVTLRVIFSMGPHKAHQF